MKQKSENRIKEELAQSKMIIERFARSCSHDLRGPLASIQGLTQIARHANADELSNCLNLIQCCAKNMQEMIRNLEAYITHSQRDLSCDELDAGNMVDIILNQYKPEIRDKGLQVVASIEQSHQWVSDHDCNFLILKNVIGNAIQFSDHEKRVRQVDIRARSNKRGMLINIRDNGIGIGKEQQTSICQPFFRASTQSQGGLGLFLVKTLTEKLGAEFSIHSQEHEGTTCSIVIPNLKKAA
ncbi:sensor histidine kinase [Chryseolinea lacunae]|uniref:histidine kinase n=1 Tax=Chryseolinea lacunae TaxID=2801331 RepID=A0ABS1KZ43_9BACT|nr:HAMP domain-containing sensor histidine kinase [Chryseolinea lacunae]MBL0744448.1 HAMP domain-containing histidine kinase [Chryseolinea lacunae]